jgi:hypothetical protein
MYSFYCLAHALFLSRNTFQVDLEVKEALQHFCNVPLPDPKTPPITNQSLLSNLPNTLGISTGQAARF